MGIKLHVTVLGEGSSSAISFGWDKTQSFDLSQNADTIVLAFCLNQTTSDILTIQYHTIKCSSAQSTNTIILAEELLCKVAPVFMQVDRQGLSCGSQCVCWRV